MKSARKIVMLAVLMTIGVLAGAPPNADASLKHLLIGTFGPGAQPIFNSADGLAIDPSTGDLLVIDAKAKTISRYQPDGNPANFSALGGNVLDGSGSGECPSKPSDCDQTPQNSFDFGEFPGEQQIAVDSSGTITNGDIYVTQGIQGTAHVVDIFASTGVYLGQLSAAGTSSFTGFSPCGVTVDDNGAIYVADNSGDKIFKFQPGANPPVNGDYVQSFVGVPQPCALAAGTKGTAGALFANRFFTFQGNSVLKLDSSTGASSGIVDPLEDRAIAVDSETGHVYALGSDGVVREFDASSDNPQLVSDFTTGENGHGVAAINGRVYVAQGSSVYEYGPAVPVADVTTGAATITSNTSATINGTVTPDGVPVNSCTVEFGLTTTYGQSTPCEESPAELGTSSTPEPVHANLVGLLAESLYHYRVVAKNENATTNGEDKTFHTPSKPEIEEEQSREVGEESATVSAELIPGNSATSLYFEWGSTEAYGATTAASTTDSETGEPLIDDANHVVRAALRGLTPGDTYHWRAVATNALGTVKGPDQIFVTYQTLGRGLPDNRAYELVSPALKGSADFGIPTPPGGAAEKSVKPQQASEAGDRVTYGSFSAVGSVLESAPASSQYLSVRTAEGWATQNLDPRFEEGGLRDPFVGFSDDLSLGALIVAEPPLTSDADASLPDLYMKNIPSGKLSALTTEPPTPFITVPKQEYCLSYGGISADSNHVIFAARGALRSTDPSGVGFNLYEWSGTSGLELISRLPGASGPPAVPHVGTGFASMSGETFCKAKETLMRHAISPDGSRIFWTYEGTFQGAKNPLFARVRGPGGDETIRLDSPNMGVTPPGGEGQFWDATADGNKVLFTDGQRLTANALSASGSPDLYLYNFEAAAGNKLTDISAVVPEPPDVRGVVGISEDGSYVYFVAKGVLTNNSNAEGDLAKSGERNLYVWHEGVIRFIGTALPTTAAQDPTLQTGRVSPDGKHLVFTSTAALTGFKNNVLGKGPCGLLSLGETTLVGNSPCEEVFLYEYEGNSLTCTSCSPANASPLGPARVPSWSTPYQQPRYLSDDGKRVFFDTIDSLTPADSNNRRDVYEFERPGIGSCVISSPEFRAKSGGCIFLLSSGEGSDESYFLDASASGSDVFISTRERLVAADVDEQFDVYDIRVDGTSSGQPSTHCGTPEECRSPTEGKEPVAPSPGTMTSKGPEAPRGVKHCRKGLRRVVRHGKTVCVRRKRHRPRKHPTNTRLRRGGK